MESSTVPFGSLAAPQDSTIPMAAIGGKADDLAERLFDVIAVERRLHLRDLTATGSIHPNFVRSHRLKCRYRRADFRTRKIIDTMDRSRVIR